LVQAVKLYYHYTPAALEDEIVRILSSHYECYLEEDENANECIRLKWDYLDQAEALLYRINLYRPLPELVIFKEDIPPGLAHELESFGKVTMKIVITNGVRRLYESVDPDYFHINGIYGKVKWRISK
jgi:hypothetical protein